MTPLLVTDADLMPDPEPTAWDYANIPTLAEVQDETVDPRDAQDAAEEKFFCSTCHHPVGEHLLLSEEDWDYDEETFHCRVTDCGCVRAER